MLKTGNKGLYVFDRDGQHYQVTPPCILDFYIHESRQRTGLGKQLFEHMLQVKQYNDLYQRCLWLNCTIQVIWDLSPPNRKLLPLTKYMRIGDWDDRTENEKKNIVYISTNSNHKRLSVECANISFWFYFFTIVYFSIWSAISHEISNHISKMRQCWKEALITFQMR